MKKKNKNTMFESIIEQMDRENQGDHFLDECMQFRADRIDKIPMRYRLIALGFVRKMSLTELNEKLKEEGCPQLYARSIWESTLIFAFLHHLSYEEWKKLKDCCRLLGENWKPEDTYFQGSNITMTELQRYVEENSESQELETRHLTLHMDRQLQKTDSTPAAFEQYLEDNRRSFSRVREKTRYYFCKYLYYNLLGKISNVLGQIEKDCDKEEALGCLIELKGISALKRKKQTLSQMRESLEQAVISCGGIFDAFNYFFLEYVSLDWLEVLMEYYGNVENLSPADKKNLADALRHYDKSKADWPDDKIIRDKVRELEKREEELDHVYSLDSENRGYQKNRTGENTIRKYIKGVLDIDRITFLCFLLFFGSTTHLPENLKITKERLDEILSECGYGALNEREDFDCFVIEYLAAEDLKDCLMETVTEYALRGENFFLYQLYRKSTSYAAEFEKVMGIDVKEK